jgi:hypothetical protein
MPARSTAASTDYIPLAAGISFALDQARSRVSVEASSCSSTTAVAARPGFGYFLTAVGSHVPPENERDRPLPGQLRGLCSLQLRRLTCSTSASGRSRRRWERLLVLAR